MAFVLHPRFLAIYSGILTVAFMVTVLYGAAAARNQTFDTISVRRINIVEPDGTVRLTISSRADFAYRDKKEYPRPDRRNGAGLLFMNEGGTEMGGLIWGGHQQPNGSVESHGHLSFDQYEQNQIFAIDAGQEGNEKFSRIDISDQGDYPIAEERRAHQEFDSLRPQQRDAGWRHFFATHRHDVKRLVLGRLPDRSVGLTLRDYSGKVRLILSVRPDGTPNLQLLDSSGNVVKEISATK
jgi:hypothetical protein